MNKPKFKVGDVVSAPLTEQIDFKTLYVIRECIEVVNKDNLTYQYDANPLNSLVSHLTERFNESDLIYRYYDKNWCKYYTESYEGNTLTRWRSGLYNITRFLIKYDNVNMLDDDEVNAFIEENNPMIRPAQMAHILKGHSICYRMNDVLIGNDEDKKKRAAIVSENLDIKSNFNKAMYNIQKKLIARNKTGLDYEDKIELSKLALPKLTKYELDFGNLFDQIDYTFDKNGNKKYTDHYPITMTNLQIMDAIRQAYNNSHKVGSLQIQFDKKDEGSLPAPNKGKRLYEGYSLTYDLIIQFWYNYDLEIIETAYPLIMNNPRKSWD